MNLLIDLEDDLRNEYVVVIEDQNIHCRYPLTTRPASSISNNSLVFLKNFESTQLLSFSCSVCGYRYVRLAQSIDQQENQKEKKESL